jgi:hypothetical protein
MSLLRCAAVSLFTDAAAHPRLLYGRLRDREWSVTGRLDRPLRNDGIRHLGKTQIHLKISNRFGCQKSKSTPWRPLCLTSGDEYVLLMR